MQKFISVLYLFFGAILVANAVPSGCNKPVTVNCNCGNSRFMLALLISMNKKLTQCLNGHGGGHFHCKTVPKNCVDVLKCGGKQSGVYSVNPDGKGAFKVYCDQETNGGGWAVIQRRKDGSVNFYRGWHDYKVGFGNLNGEFWLGLENIHRLTHQVSNRLHVELDDIHGKTVYADYDYFSVANENLKYRLTVGKYSGTAGDSLTYHNGASFSTKDRDNDSYPKNCAKLFKGGWWYKSCHYANLNGLYLLGKQKSYANGINWYTWKGYHYSAKRAEMMIKPKA